MLKFLLLEGITNCPLYLFELPEGVLKFLFILFIMK